MTLPEAEQLFPSPSCSIPKLCPISCAITDARKAVEKPVVAWCKMWEKCGCVRCGRMGV